MDLFDQLPIGSIGTPLAERLRPSRLEDFIGQTKAVGPGSPLRRQIEKDEIPSLILWGPPGCGKSTLARIIGALTRREFISVNAIEVGAKVLKELGDAARDRKRMHQVRTIVFIDEIHRLNKSQQDVLLPYVEKADFSLIGATTENPSFELTGALLSRCKIVIFQRLGTNELSLLADRTFVTYVLERSTVIDESAFLALVALSDGDGRRFLNMLEEILFAFEMGRESKLTWPLSAEQITALAGKKITAYNKTGDDRYDLLSAFIKSMRGSDADAALYYLARLLEGGEDPLVIARRMIVLASEDVGNADPRALQLAVTVFQAVQMVGLPEAAINLAHIVTYLASAPKSNRSYMGLKRAQAEVERTGQLPIPLSIRNAPTKTMKDLGYGEGYSYAHDGARGWLPQQFLPDEIKDQHFYEPGEHGFEKTIREYVLWLKGQSKKT